MSDFVHLHLHSHYSLLEALPKVKDLVKHVSGMGMDAVAVTDNGTLYGTIEFYQKAKDAGVKPIIGIDAYVARESRHLKRARVDTKPHRLVLLAENNVGYKNLLQISSIGFMEGFYYKPRIDKEVLQNHHEGIIALSGGHMGEIDELLKMGKKEEAAEVARFYNDLFGQGNFFLELVDRPEIAEQETTNMHLVELGRELGIPVVATKNCFYLNEDDVEAWKILNCIKGGKTLEHFDRVNQFEYDASVVSGQYMKERFADVPEAIENTRKIADRCEVEIELGVWNFPNFVIPEGKTFLEVLTERAYKELEEKEGTLTDEMKERLEYELDIIDQKGFCAYFLIVSDFISWARSQGIATTTRGSAAGSLVGYSIGISTIQPLHYQLPFERFLNPERPSAPDVDADFADNRRDEVLDYVREKYGHEKVAQICTFGTMLARGSVRDVGRALGFPYGVIDEIAKLIPMGSQGFPMTLERAIEEEPELKKRYNNDANVQRVINLAMRIEGCARHVSIHAAGTVISPTDLTDFTPLQIDTREGKIITQYEMKSVESAGLVKMDFLGIRNLSILGDAVRMVKATKGDVIVPEEIPVEDEKTFHLLAKGHTMGVFQLSGDGMTKYLMDLKPERVEDIMAMVALYRPGPMEMIPEYIQRKEGKVKTTFMDPRMEAFLQKSYGLLVYQDDVMLTAIHLAGYSWLEADKLRKAMGKKIPEEMAKQKVKLLDGFVEHGLSKKKAQNLWKMIEPFAAYGFNKAHAASYGMVAYQTAYMKANYPAEYMTALMTAESGDLEKISEAVNECERMGIAVLPPDINESLKNFTYVDDQTIRFGLLVIKNLGAEVIESIIAEREKNGEYKDLADFAGRVHHRAFNKKSLEALIKAGALDRFGERKRLLTSMDRILMHNKNVQREKALNQQTLFAAAPQVMDRGIALRPCDEATVQERLAWEKELLGLYVSSHPFEQFASAFGSAVCLIEDLEKQKDGAFVNCGGVLTFSKKILTKKGDEMAFAGLEDTTGSTELIVFPKTFATQKHKLIEEQVVLVSAKVSKRDGDAKLILNRLMPITEVEIPSLKQMLLDGLWIEPDVTRVIPDDPTDPLASPPKTGGVAAPPKQPTPQHTQTHTPSKRYLSIALHGRPSQEQVAQLRTVLQASPGREPVRLLVDSGGKQRAIETDYAVSITPDLLKEVRLIVGPDAVSVSEGAGV